MFHKVLNVSLVFLPLSKLNARNLSTVDDEIPKLKSSDFSNATQFKLFKILNTTNLIFSGCLKEGANHFFFSDSPQNFQIN